MIFFEVYEHEIEVQLDYTSVTNSTTSSIQLQKRQIKEVNGISKAKRIKANAGLSNCQRSDRFDRV